MGKNLSPLKNRGKNKGWLTKQTTTSLEKTGIILEALDCIEKPVDYYTLDVCPHELDRTLEGLRQRLSPNSCVKCHHLASAYEEAIPWVANNQAFRGQTITCLWLGSSIANETSADIQNLLQNFNAAKHESQLATMQFIISLDGCKDMTKIGLAYDTPDGLSRKFALNSLRHANAIIGHEASHASDWVFREIWDSQQLQYTTCVSPTKDVPLTVGSHMIHIPAMELVKVISSRKIGTQKLKENLAPTGFVLKDIWMHSEVEYGMYWTMHHLLTGANRDLFTAVHRIGLDTIHSPGVVS